MKTSSTQTSFSLSKEDIAKEYADTRTRYRSEMLIHSKNNKKRIDLNMKFANESARIYTSTLSKLEISIINDDLSALQEMIDEKPSTVHEKILGFPLLYMAARYGSCFIVENFLQSGYSISFESFKSTPAHVAAYFGHEEVLKLLIKYGVSINQNNSFKHLPKDEAGTPRIKEILNSASLSFTYNLSQQIGGLSKQKYPTINIIGKNGDIIIKKIMTDRYSSYDNLQGYVDTFHGTHYNNLYSIVKNGLRKPGDVIEGKKIEIPSGHIRQGRVVQKVSSWSNAVFSSPSIYYASNSVYSHKLVQNGVQWLPVLQLKVRQGSFGQHLHTFSEYKHKKNEPKNVEFRVQDLSQVDKKGKKIENIVVVSVILIRKEFLNKNEDYDEVTDLIFNSREEQCWKRGLSKQRMKAIRELLMI